MNQLVVGVANPVDPAQFFQQVKEKEQSQKGQRNKGHRRKNIAVHQAAQNLHAAPPLLFELAVGVRLRHKSRSDQRRLRA